MTIKQQGGIFGRNPTFNNVEVESLSVSSLTDNKLLVAGSSGELESIADISYSGTSLTVSTTTYLDGDKYLRDGTVYINNNGTGSAVIEVGDSNDVGIIKLMRNGNNYIDAPATAGATAFRTGPSDTLRMDVRSDGNVKLHTGNLIIGTSGKGIDFSATSGTGTSELFDDYEEGTWTPLFTDGTNNATMSAFNAGFYTKVGNLVTVSGYIEASSLGSMSGDVKLAGLPFTTPGTGGAHTGSAAGWGNNLNITAGQVVGMITDLGTTTIGLKLWDASTGATNLQASEMLSNTVITINLTYRAA